MSASQVNSVELSKEKLCGDGDIAKGATQVTAVSSVATVTACSVDRKLVGFSQRMKQAVLSHLRLGEIQKENVPKPSQTFPQCRFGSACDLEHPRCKYGVECPLRGCVYAHVASEDATLDPTPHMRRTILLRRHVDRAVIADATLESTRHPRHLRRRNARAPYVIPHRART